MKNSLRSMLALCPILFALNFVLPTQLAGQDIEWQYDLRSGISKAEAENKLVLLHFTASWCRPCQALEKFVFPNLEVARSVNDNVIPIRIDVDEEQSLVTEYGVTAVPFDVVITPGGRVIAKQKSPLDSNGFRRMMAGLSTPVKDLEDQSKVALAQKLNEFSDQFNFKPPQISQFKDHTPEVPSHQPPASSAESAKLARRTGMISNPFFATEQTKSSSKPKSVSNSFAVSLDQEITPPAPALKKAVAQSNDFAARSQSAFDAFEVSLTNDFSAKPTAKEIKLEAPVIKSEFEVITGAELEKEIASKNQPERKPQFSLAKQKEFNEITPNAEPKLSFQADAGPELVQLMKERQPQPRQTSLAENVPPVQVQQDRFFQKPTAPATKSVNQTRVVAPRNTAQALLKPVHQIGQRAMPSSTQPTNDTRALAQNQRTPGARVQQLLQPQPRPQSILEQHSHAQPRDVAINGQANAAAAVNQQMASQTNARSKPGVALKGKCPVTLLQEGKWIAGNAKFGCIHRDRLYMFANAEKLKMFQANPDFYSPILAGFDPVVFHQEGRLVDGIAQHGVFMGKAPNQRVLLFRDAQTRALFQAQPTAYMNTVRQAMSAKPNTNGPVMR